MEVIGIAVRAQDPKRPVARIAVAESTGTVVSINDVFDLPSDDVELPVLLHDAAEALRSRLKSVKPDRVVVRRADWARQARQTDGPKYRLMLEGALTSASQSVIPDTRIGTGKETSEWFGSSKAVLDAEAEKIVTAQGLGSKYKEAVSAALAGVALGP